MAASNPFVTEPTEPQKLFLESVAHVFLADEQHRWPSWAWLEEVLERKGYSAQAILSSMPRETTHNYGFVWPMRASAPSGQDQVGLTIAGLRHVELASALVGGLCGLISALGTIRSQIELDPYANERPRASMSSIAEVEALERGRPTAPISKDLLPFLTKEPSTWHCQLVDSSTDDWIIELSPEVRRFGGIADADDYLDRLAAMLASQVSLGDQVTRWISPFTLPAAVDYLDAVWRLKFDSPLVTPPGVERSARLAFTVSNIEEADSALSALAELLKGLQVPGVPGVGGHPLERLGPFLAQHLGAVAIPRVEEAINILDAVRSMRASAQHIDAQPKTIAALGTVGLSFPVADWAEAWAQVQSAVAYACDVIRQEVHASL